MKRLLIAYVSHSGSTRETAEFLCKELSAQGQQVDVRPISEISDISEYDRIIAGGLLYRFGWHPEITQFLKKNLLELKKKKIALFITGLRIVKTPYCDQAPFPVFIDPSMMKPLVNNQGLSIIDRYTSINGYLRNVLPMVEELKPISLGFFAGKLDFNTLKLPEKVIMYLLILFTGIKAGDHRNWESIRKWEKSLGSMS